MVDAINATNNQKPPVVNSPKPSFSSPVQQVAPALSKDEVTITKKNSPSKQPLNKTQIAGLVIGGLAALGSVAVAGIFLKTSGIFGSRKLLKEIKNADLPKEIKDKLLEEYAKMKGSLVDSGGSKNYIREVLKLAKCFKKPETNLVDINAAREILDKKIIGMQEVKAQVIDFLKVRNYHIKNGTNDSSKLILCLVGVPGAGKTAVAEVVAEAMGVPFARIGLSSVDKATQIVGGERIWQGAAPGKIIKALQETQQGNSAILLDEIDKLGHNVQHGDPADALLDVLEPKQCKHFTDNYLEFQYDLSNVNFIMTANDLQRMPSTLKDRVHIIKIPTYTAQVKKDICKLEIANKLAAANIAPEKVMFDNSALEQMVRRGLDDNGQISGGARKALENLDQVFRQVIISLDENPNSKKLVIDARFVDNALDKYKNK